MSTTRRRAGAGASVGGGPSWINPGNITASDDTRAAASLSNFAQTSAQLQASSMTIIAGDPIPAGATITAGRVIVEAHATASEMQFQEVAFYLGDTLVGTAAAAQVVTDIGTDGLYTFSPTAELTPAIVNDETFNVRLRGKWNSGGSIAAWVDTVEDEYDWEPPESGAAPQDSGARTAAEMVMGVQ